MVWLFVILLLACVAFGVATTAKWLLLLALIFLVLALWSIRELFKKDLP